MDNESLEASSGICGTLAGALSYQEPGKEILLDPEILVINPNIKIKGGNNTGGIIGALYNGTLTGTYKPEFNAANVIVSKIPRPIFPGNINSEKPYRENAAYVGGIVGYADKSTLRRLLHATFHLRQKYSRRNHRICERYSNIRLRRENRNI